MKRSVTSRVTIALHQMWVSRIAALFSVDIGGGGARGDQVLSSKIDNLINLNDLTEEAILHNLRIRFKASVAALL